MRDDKEYYRCKAWHYDSSALTNNQSEIFSGLYRRHSSIRRQEGVLQLVVYLRIPLIKHYLLYASDDGSHGTFESLVAW